MSIYKLHVEDRNYSSWTVYETIHFKSVEIPNFNPIENKLFSNDFFELCNINDNNTNNNNNIKMIHSTVRSGGFLPGVLVLHGNKTYGRKNGKLLYKCIPDDKRLPVFLIPYEMKQMGFSKVFINLYVTFYFSLWEDKHPHGILNQVIGPVDKLDNFYEYQLYCKSLNASIQKFQKDTSKALQNRSHDAFIENIREKFKNIEDRTNLKDWYVFSIDPNSSLDFDDAFSIKTCDADKNIKLLSIYISNVTLWLDVLNLWDSFSKRISTIYLPDRKRPMMPTILSDCLCSLQEKNTRIALVMDIYIQDNNIININYSNCTIRVVKNFVYEEEKLLINPNYQQLLELSRALSQKYKYISNIKDSHDLVSYLMIFMNYHCAKEMMKYKNGIFRTTIMNRNHNVSDSVPDTVPDEISKYIKIWKSAAGQYIDGADLEENENIELRHVFLELDAYIHITSPIRRLVDLLNIIKIQQNLGMIQLSENAFNFYNKWLQELDYINVTMRSIRKVQTDCSLLDLCSNHPLILEKEYQGYLFDKLRNDGLYQFIVFLPELKLSSRITLRDNLNNYENKMFRLFLFHDEENFKKKIRLQIL